MKRVSTTTSIGATMRGMNPPRMRPVFRVALERPDRFLPALRDVLGASDAGCEGTVFRRHAALQVAESARHFFSPYLYLELRNDREREDAAHERSSDEPAGPYVHGRFAPHPHVWTFFMAIYGLLAIAAIAGGVWGLSVWALGEAPWTLLAVPGSIALMGFTYGAAFIGQGLGAPQMYDLRRAVDRAVERASET